ncbi:ribonuclease 3 [Spirochaetia bacterium]|nr:ribonuclease 3 [Spirochaetia bacterium]
MPVSALPEISSARRKELRAFQRAIGVKFKNPALLNLAFVHRSVSNESYTKSNNERLEFLGDSILGAVTATLLYRALAGNNEGDLAKIKSIVVSEETLSGIARELQIDTMMLLGHGEELSGGRGKKALLADTLEALFGALYLDSGYKSAFTLISRVIAPEIERVREKRGFQDYKSLLQELCQRRYKSYPTYKVLKQAGPEHEHFFWIEVCVNGKNYGPGMGKNKKNAEQEAAKAALEQLNKQGG